MTAVAGRQRPGSIAKHGAIYRPRGGRRAGGAVVPAGEVRDKQDDGLLLQAPVQGVFWGQHLGDAAQAGRGGMKELKVAAHTIPKSQVQGVRRVCGGQHACRQGQQQAGPHCC